MAAIFLFSAQNREQSTAVSDEVTDTVIKINHPDYESLSPERKLSISYHTKIDMRTYAHMSIYCALCFLLTAFLFSLKINKYLAEGIGLVATVLFAISDEWHQSFVPGRNAAWADVLKDTHGALIGFALCIIVSSVFYFVKSIKKRRGISRAERLSKPVSK